MSFGSSGFGGFGSNTNQQSSPFGGSGFGANNANTTNNTTSTGFGGFGANNTTNNTGSSLFGSNNNNNTNTNTAGGFGNASGGFGANNQTSSFGQNRTGGFGASSTPSGGLFGNAANNSTSGGFGGFGASSAQNTSSPFGGGATTNTGGSLFGQNNQASSTGFGGTTNTSSPFGASNTTSVFGSNSGGFGGSTTTPAFGSSASAQQNNGTGGAPFQAFVDKDGVGGQQQQYMSITCQEPYRNFSFEELRVQDYLQGRRYGNSNGQGGAFGASTGFGGFGGNNTTSTSSPFGGNNNTNTSTPFGAQSSAPAFGSTTTSTAGGFGSSGGLFGQNKSAAGNLFGSTSTPANQQSTSLFGNNNNTSTPTNNAFGGNTSGGGLFGTPKPTTGFGTTTTTNAFGANNNQNSTGGGLFGNNNNSSNAGALNLFGNNSQQQQQPTGNSFGGSLFSGNTGGATQQANQTTGGGLFGNSSFGANSNNNQAKPGGLFGGTTNTGTGGGLFGGSNAGGQQQQTGTGTGGLFGNPLNNNNQQAQNTGGGLFGAPKQTTTTGLFGGTQANTNTGGTGLFGGTQNNTGGGLFGGSQPANNTGSGLFGAASNHQKPGGLFGGSTFGSNNNNTAGGNSLFGTQTQNNNNNQSLFGGSLLSSQPPQQQQLQQQQAAQGLTASISSNTPYGNNELFASLATPQQSVGPLATPLSSSQKQRKPAPLAQWKINPAASSRLITPQKRTGGYGFSYSTYGTPGSAYGSPSLYGGLLSGGNSSRLNKSLSTSNLRTTYGGGGETVLNPDAFSPSPRSYRSGGSLKKLHINRNLRSDLFGNEDGTQKSSPLKKAVSFDPDQSQGSNGDGSSTALTRIDDSDSATPSAEDLGYMRSPPKTTTNGSVDANGTSDGNVEQIQGNELAVVPEDEPEGESRGPEQQQQQQQRPMSMFPDQSDKTPGEYWTKPSKAEVAKMSRQQRKSVKGFTVGREQTGSIEFSEVNLDGVDLDRVIGKDIRITVREATVYPDDLNKPPPGKGFNVPSTITLFNAWPRARAGHIPVYERRGKRYEKHIERLQKVTGTEFVDYDPSNGSWTFRVKHFSTYQVPEYYYDDDEPLEFTSSMFSVPADPLASQGASSGQSFQKSQDFVLGNGSLRMDDPFASQSNRLPGAFDEDFFLDRRILSNGFKESKPIDEEVVKSTSGPTQSTLDNVQSSQTPEQSFLGNSASDLDGTMEVDGPRHSPVLDASLKPKSILKASQQLPYLGGTPTRAADPTTGDWADQLQRTVSPKKQIRSHLEASLRQGNSLNGSITKETAPFATSLDVFKSLFGGSEKEKSSTTKGKGFQWPYPKRSQLGPDAKQDQEDEWRAIFKPSWAGAELGLGETPVASDMMQAQRQLSTFRLEDGVPQAEMKSSFSFATLADAAESQAGKATSPGQLRLQQEESTMWRLAHLLFDEVQDDSEHREEDESRTRKDKVKDFWARLVEAPARAQADEATTPETKAIAYLSCRQVEAATHTLSEGRDYRLAMSVAQIGAVEEMRDGMAQQLEHWRDNNSLSEMPAHVRVLYELLAGNTTVSEGKTGAGPENRAADIFIAKECNLDWRRSFGLRLWYGSPSAENLAGAILSHHLDLEQGEEKVEPAPWFAEGDKFRGGQDILWGLLKVFVMYNTQGVDRGFYDAVWDGYGKMIAARNVVGDATQTRLTFQLYQTLAARGIIDHDSEGRGASADQHALDLGYELGESASNLADAVFVTLHILDAALRERAVKALLDRHAGAIGDDGETSPLYRTLTDDFQIPEAWLWAAKASYARKVLHDDAVEMRCLLRAGERRAAHEALRHRVGPRAVIEEQLDTLRQVLGDFEAAGVAKSADWPSGGGLYADYAALMALPRASSAKKAERRRFASKLLRTLPAVDAAELALEERAAVADIADVSARVLKEDDGAAGATAQGDAQDATSKTVAAAPPSRSEQQDATLRETLRLADRWAARALLA